MLSKARTITSKVSALQRRDNAPALLAQAQRPPTVLGTGDTLPKRGHSHHPTPPPYAPHCRLDRDNTCYHSRCHRHCASALTANQWPSRQPRTGSRRHFFPIAAISLSFGRPTTTNTAMTNLSHCHLHLRQRTSCRYHWCAANCE